MADYVVPANSPFHIRPQSVVVVRHVRVTAANEEVAEDPEALTRHWTRDAPIPDHWTPSTRVDWVKVADTDGIWTRVDYWERPTP